MADKDFAQRVEGLAALAEPVRRALYLFVAAQPEPVSRDQAASGVGVARHTAKFHLDRLVSDGLLEARFRRLTGRTGPGAGRPAKLYVRTADDVAVSLPERRYDLAGRLMAEAIDESVARGVPVLSALQESAGRHGRELALEAGELDVHPPDGDLVARTCTVLTAQGYEPRADGSEIELANCPFHALVADHARLVCGMNLALLDGVGQGLGEGSVTARLDPAPGRCCVVLAVT